MPVLNGKLQSQTNPTQINAQDKFVNSKSRFRHIERPAIKVNGTKSIFEKNKIADNGKFTFNDGRFEGQYILKKHGLGKYEWANGQTYEGEWYENKIHGFGVYKWPDGRSYRGEWKDNQMNGIGCYQWSNGRKYIGEYMQNKKHGYGLLL